MEGRAVCAFPRIADLSGWHVMDEFLIDGKIAGGKAAENHFADGGELWQCCIDGINRDSGGKRYRIAVDARTDARKCNGACSERR